jgi:hypothetical protein
VLALVVPSPRDQRRAGEGVNATAAEVERGWVEFACSVHGVLVVASPTCTVKCRCGRRARRTLNGTALKARDIERLRQTVQKSLQIKGSISPNGTARAKKRPGRPRGRIDEKSKRWGALPLGEER